MADLNGDPGDTFQTNARAVEASVRMPYGICPPPFQTNARAVEAVCGIINTGEKG